MHQVFASQTNGNTIRLEMPDSQYPKIFENFPLTFPRVDPHTISGTPITNLEKFFETPENSLTFNKQKVFIDGEIPDENKFFEKLKTFEDLKHLRLSNTSLTCLDFSSKLGKKLDRLIRLEVSGDKIRNSNQIILALLSCPKLQTIDYQGTRFGNDRTLKRKILCRFPNLNVINSELVTPYTYSQYVYGYKNCTKEVLQSIFRNLVLRLPDIQYYHYTYRTKFNPKLLVALQLTNMQLKEVFLSEFTELVDLSLAGNNIESINNSGIECCQNLISVDLSDNMISYADDISDLAFLPKLMHVTLHSNELDNYRPSVISLFRHLPGTALLSGIQTIDGIPVTIEEFVSSLWMSSNEEFLRQKWNYNLQMVVGGNRISKDISDLTSILQSLECLSLPCRGIHYVDLSNLTNLKYLNLRGNFIEDIHSLSKCTKLEYLDLSNNATLNMKSIEKQIQSLHELFYLSISYDHSSIVPKLPSDTTAVAGKNLIEESSFNIVARNALLRHILPHCPKLAYLDRIKVTIADRYNLSHDKQQSDPIIMQHAYFLRSINTTCSVDDLSKKEVYEAEYNKVISFTVDRDFHFITDLSDLSLMKSLHHLDLSPKVFMGNADNLKNYLKLFQGKIPRFICELKQLETVNLNSLNLESDIEGRVLIIKSLPSLMKFDCHDNNEKIKMDLLSQVLNQCTDRIYNFADKLYHVDIDIDLTKLLEIGVTPANKDRVLIAAKYTINHETEPHNVKYLSLSNIGFQSFDLGPLQQAIQSVTPQIESSDLKESWMTLSNRLFYLDISKNNLSANKLTDFKFKYLRVLDISENEFTKPDEVGQIVANIPTLKNVLVHKQNKTKYQPIDYRKATVKAVTQKIWDDINQPKSKEHYEKINIPIGALLLAKLFLEYPLKAIDDAWIMPSEISEAIKSVTGEKFILPIDYKLVCALARRDPRHYIQLKYFDDLQRVEHRIQFSELKTTLNNTGYSFVDFDYSNCELAFDTEHKFTEIGFNFTGLYRFESNSKASLNFDNNLIDEEQLSNLKIILTVSRFDTFENLNMLHPCKDVKALSIRNNNIGLGDNAKEFVQFVKCFINLEELDFRGNPIAQTENFAIFLKNFEPLLDYKFPIKKINGLEITEEWRLNYIKESFPDKYETFYSRMKIDRSFDTVNYSLNERLLNLSNMSLNFIDWHLFRLEVMELDLSNNEITYLPDNAIVSMVNLNKLNISNNQIVNNRKTPQLFNEVLIPLQDLVNLKVLKMEGCFKDKTYDSAKYFTKMCEEMRYLHTLNDAKNPYLFTESQILHAGRIQELAQLEYKPCSTTVDLSHCALDNSQVAVELADCCAVLNISKIFLPNDNLKDLQTIFLTRCPSIRKINGRPVDYKHRLQARKEYNKNIETFVLPEFIDEKMEIYDKATDYIQKIREAPEKYGSLASKFEIFITFEQIMLLIVNYIKQIKWPKIFLKMANVILLLALNVQRIVDALKKVFAFAFDISLPTPLKFFQYFVYSVVPILCIIFYHYEPDKDLFYTYCQSRFKRAIFYCVWLLFMMLVCFWGVSAIFTLNQIVYYKAVVETYYGYVFWLSLLAIGIFIFLVVSIYLFKKRSDQDENGFWWDEFKIHKSSLCLFIITVMYEPSVSFFTSIIQCSEEDDTLSAAFDDLICLDPKNPLGTLTFAHAFATAFMIIYAIWIPIFFVYEILDAVKYIRSARGILLQEEEIKRYESQIKLLKKYDAEAIATNYNDGNIDIVVIDSDVNDKRKKHDLQIAKERLEFFKTSMQDCYAEECKNYDHPASYLYSQYTLTMRYMKILDMIQKVGTLVASTIFKTFLLGTVAVHAIIHTFLGISLLFQPLYSKVENTFKSLSQGGNSGTIIIGEVIQSDKFETILTNPLVIHLAVPGLLLLFLLSVLVVFLFLSIKYHCNYCVGKKNAPPADIDQVDQSSTSNRNDPTSGEVDFDYATLRLDYDPGDAPEDIVAPIAVDQSESHEEIEIPEDFICPHGWKRFTYQDKKDAIDKFLYFQENHKYVNGVEVPYEESEKLDWDAEPNQHKSEKDKSSDIFAASKSESDDIFAASKSESDDIFAASKSESDDNKAAAKSDSDDIFAASKSESDDIFAASKSDSDDIFAESKSKSEDKEAQNDDTQINQTILHYDNANLLDEEIIRHDTSDGSVDYTHLDAVVLPIRNSRLHHYQLYGIESQEIPTKK